MGGRFLMTDEGTILEGRTTDVYFDRTQRILEQEGLDRTMAVGEFTTADLPKEWPWAVFAGLDEALSLLEGRGVDVHAVPEGTVFTPVDAQGVRVPVMEVRGPYGEFCMLETPLLGLICQATGVATKSARVKRVAGDLEVLSFGVRRMHPALAPMLDYYAYMGGCDAVSTLAGGEATGTRPKGTMPHALVIVMGDPGRAFRAFHSDVDSEVPRIALVDTYHDEKHEALVAAEAIGEALEGVRLDTPGSRKGDFPHLIREVRWELDLRGFRDVRIYVSGGIDEDSIPELAAAGAAGFGVGTSISNAPTVNFAMDLVEVEGRPAAKRGKFGGAKELFRCPGCASLRVTPRGALETDAAQPPVCPRCGVSMGELMVKVMEGGQRVAPAEAVEQKRERVLAELGRVTV